MMVMMMMNQLVVLRMWIWEVGSVVAARLLISIFGRRAEKNLKSGNYIRISNFLFYLSSVLFHQRNKIKPSLCFPSQILFNNCKVLLTLVKSFCKLSRYIPWGFALRKHVFRSATIFWQCLCILQGYVIN